MATTFESTTRARPELSDDRRSQHRPMRSADGRRTSLISGQEVNVGEKERLVSMAAGSILVLQGVGRRNLMGLLIAGVGGSLVYRGATGHCMLYQALDLDTANGIAGTARRARRGMHLTQSLLVDKSPEELYSYWRNLENLPRIMTHIDSVQVMDDRRSHWVAKASRMLGAKVEWDAEITDEQPNRRIAWRSLPGSIVEHQGSVEFNPTKGDRGTAVRVVMDYTPPVGQVGQLVAKVFSKALGREIREDLRNFKQTMEIGEALTVDGQPHGTCLGRGMRTQE